VRKIGDLNVRTCSSSSPAGYLTRYSFSLENWKRPARGSSFLMQITSIICVRNGRR